MSNIKKENIFQKLFNVTEDMFTKQMVAVTSRATKRYGLKLDKDGNAIDCEADAFRHTFMQCFLAYRAGNKIAKYLGDKHEHGKDPNIEPNTNMDLWNNQIGREIAEEIKKENGSDIDLIDWDLFEYLASEKIIEKMKKGELITEPFKDKRKYTNMEKERLQDKDRVFYEDEFWDELDDNERIRFREHYTNYKNQHQKGLPSKKELDAKVSTGDLIYVNNYVRSDGRKVNGYYRRRPVH